MLLVCLAVRHAQGGDLTLVVGGSSMRLQVRDLCVILGSVVVLLFFAIGEDTERHYCTSCGLLKGCTISHSHLVSRRRSIR